MGFAEVGVLLEVLYSDCAVWWPRVPEMNFALDDDGDHSVIRESDQGLHCLKFLYSKTFHPKFKFVY